jgi:hypothetical protein
MKSEYYELRGWGIQSGLPKLDRLKELGLEDIAEDLQKKDLLAGKEHNRSRRVT